MPFVIFMDSMSGDALLKRLGAKIKKERQRKQLSQQQLGLACGINANFISKIEMGKANPTIKTLNTIAKGLKMKLVELFLPLQ